MGNLAVDFDHNFDIKEVFDQVSCPGFGSYKPCEERQQRQRRGLDHSTTVITMETVSRPVGGLPLVAEANHAKFHTEQQNMLLCCLLFVVLRV
jgi:hypothetical protein